MPNPALRPPQSVVVRPASSNFRKRSARNPPPSETTRADCQQTGCSCRTAACGAGCSPSWPIESATRSGHAVSSRAAIQFDRFEIDCWTGAREL